MLTKDKNGEFRLAKYFVSYLKIKNNQDFADSNLKDFIVCTNINFDLDQNTVEKLKVKTSGPNERMEILVDAIDTSDVFFKDSGTRYRFSCTHNNMISVMQPAFKKAVEEAVKELKKEIEELRGKSDQSSKRKLERNLTWQSEFKRMTNEGKLEDTIKEFFDKLVFAVDQPNESQLEELMKDEISNKLARQFKYFGDNEFAYYEFFMMVLGWMKDREGHFL